MAILIISTGGLIYDGITNVIVSYLEAMDLTKLRSEERRVGKECRYRW